MATWRERFGEAQRARGAAGSRASSSSGNPVPVDSDDSGDDEPARDPELLTAPEASAALFEYLVTMRLSGRRFTSRAVCTIAFLASKAGAVGDIEKLALSPARTGGHHSQFFDDSIGLSDVMRGNQLDTISVPGYTKLALGRTDIQYSAALVYDTLSSELAALQNMEAEVRRACDELGDLYWKHPVVEQAKGENPNELFVPIALYQDGVAFQWDRKDGATGIWVINLVTGRRHLAVVTRKKHKCRCGCAGWCGSYVCYRFVAWLLNAMREGRHPSERYDGSSWGSTDMRSMGGKPLGYKALCVMLKGDWMEMATNMGFNMWNHTQHPCFVCMAHADPAGPPHTHIQSLDNISPTGTPWIQKDDRYYDEACDACEHRVHVADKRSFERIVGALLPDKRKNGVRGRALAAGFPALELSKGMRLEPSEDHMDIYAVDEYLEHWPDDGLHLSFWNCAHEKGARHRNPLFHPSTGVLRNCIAPDELHAMHLGVLGDMSSFALWRIILDDGLGVGRSATEATTHQLRGERLQHELSAWYSRRKADGFPVEEISDYVFNLIGTVQRPDYSGKAGASGGLLRFSVDMLKRCRGSIADGDAWVAAGEALVSYLDITRNAGFKLSARDHQALFDGCVVFRRAAKRCGIPFRPKHHMYIHLVISARWFGNPRFTGTWIDEGLNSSQGGLAAVARDSHPLVWSRRILATFAHDAGPAARLAQGSSQRKRRRNP